LPRATSWRICSWLGKGVFLCIIISFMPIYNGVKFRAILLKYTHGCSLRDICLFPPSSILILSGSCRLTVSWVLQDTSVSGSYTAYSHRWWESYDSPLDYDSPLKVGVNGLRHRLRCLQPNSAMQVRKNLFFLF
jgi:hypothetical protein